MITFSFAFAVVICAVIMIIMFLLLLNSIREYYFPKKAKYLQYRNAKANNYQTDLSVLFFVTGHVDTIREQIESISKLIEENYPENFKYQILAMHQPIPNRNLEIVFKNTFKNNSHICFIEMKKSIPQNFMAACARANGRVIVSAEYLTQEIEGINEREPEFIDFQERSVETLFHKANNYHYLIPIACSKLAADKIFPYIPNIDYGYSNLMYNIAVKESVRTRIIRGRYEPVVDSPLEIILTELFTRLC